MAGDNQILLVDEDRHSPAPFANRRDDLRDLFGRVLEMTRMTQGR
jgi:hypothetical protein